MKDPLARNLATLEPEQLQQLLETSAKLSSTLDLKQLLQMVLTTATDLTNTEAASILLVDSRNGQLQFAASTGGGSGVSELIVPMEGSAAGWIVQNRQPLVLKDANSDARHYSGVDSSTQFMTRNMLGVPLTTKERVIGALEVINKRHLDTYTPQDTALLQALASQAAVAIENARLFLQTDLIAEFMHEVKTPLMALTAASELMSRQENAAERQDTLSMIQRETKRLSKMAQDFLDLARLESGRLHLTREAVDMNSLIEDVVAIQSPQARRRDIVIKATLPDTLPIVVGDGNRLKQVLLNLTSNAIKYNREGGRIDITAAGRDDQLVVSVSDTGSGIKPENLDRLFERFYRVPDSEGFSEGAGLGLAISKKILEEHGGQIEVYSRPGKGSTFECLLPASDSGLRGPE